MAVLEPVLVLSIGTTLNILKKPPPTLSVLPCLVRRLKRARRPPYRPPWQRLGPFPIPGLGEMAANARPPRRLAPFMGSDGRRDASPRPSLLRRRRRRQAGGACMAEDNANG